MSASKITTGLILFAKNEAVYGQGGALTGSTDTISLFREFPTFTYEFVYDGTRDGASYSGGSLKKTAPSGRTTTGTVILEGKGLGSTYGASAFPPSLHAFLKASGLSGSLSGSVWKYVPTPLGTTPDSLTMAVYDRGEMLPVSGAYASFTMNGEGAAPTSFEFAVQGLAGEITDVSNPPARTYIAKNVVPPKNENIGLTIGAVSGLKVRSYSYDHGLEITPRVNINTPSGHAGFVIGRRSPVFQVTVESEALSTFNPYDDFNAGTSRAITYTVGADATNRFTVNLPNCQLTGVEKAEDGPVALWNLTFAPHTSGPDAEDDFEVLFS